MKLIIAALAVCFASAVNALTVTFDHNNLGFNPATGGQFGESQGFLYDFSYLYLYDNHLALHDDSGITTSTIKAQNGTRFSVQSADVRGFSRVFMTGSDPNPADPFGPWLTAGTAPPVTLVFQGIRGGSVVATQSVSATQWVSPWSTLAFSPAFTAIDQLSLTLSLPNAIRHQVTSGANTVWCQQYCGEFWVDNLQVAPVPLPASGLLLIGGLMGLLGYRRFTAL